MSGFEWQECGYGCGKPWRRWNGSKLKGHALCAASPDLQDDVLALVERFPRATIARVAADLGVSSAVVRAWISAALKRRAARRRA